MRVKSQHSSIGLLLILVACGGGETETEAPLARPGEVLVSEAHDEHLRAIAQMRPAHPAFGEELRVELELRAGSTVELEKYSLGTLAGHFRVRSSESDNAADSGPERVHRWRARLDSPRSGKHIGRLPPVPYRLAGESDTRLLELPSFEVEIQAPDASTEIDLEELASTQPPLPLAEKRRLAPALWYSLGAVAALVIVAFLARRQLRRRREPAAERIDPCALALEELAALAARGLVEQGLFAEFYYELTRIVREFIERTSAVRAPELTTEEFLRAIERDPGFSAELRGGLQLFLERADMVKYAAQIPAGTAVEESLAAARSFIARPAMREEAA